MIQVFLILSKMSNKLQKLDPVTLAVFADVIDEIVNANDDTKSRLNQIALEIHYEINEYYNELSKQEEEWYMMKQINMGLSPS